LKIILSSLKKLKINKMLLGGGISLQDKSMLSSSSSSSVWVSFYKTFYGRNFRLRSIS